MGTYVLSQLGNAFSERVQQSAVYGMEHGWRRFFSLSLLLVDSSLDV